MSGVQSGTRLERLTALHQRARHHLAHAVRRGDPTGEIRLLVQDIEHAIVAEQHHAHEAARTATDRAATRRLGQQAATTAYRDRLAALGATSSDVRAWAVDQGLIPAGGRGRLPSALVRAYADAHQDGAPA